ncbi:MAG: ATP-dependent helicase [Egibacteraceae bacterium]
MSTMSNAVAPLLDGLNPDQRAAVEATTGPVCLLAGAGSGKTRTITHRIAAQVRSGVARPEQILAVTFTDKAATELRHRLRLIGLERPVRAATFHAAAWAQLRYFWPRIADGGLPEVLPRKVGILLPTARRLKVEARDLAAEIEWAKARALDPEAYARAASHRQPPVGVEEMAAIYARYEQQKSAAGAIDYEDMLLLTADLLRRDESAARTVRERYRFFTVDEFQDVNPAQWQLLRAWLGESRELCVVGDDDQTIYTFTGASSGYLTGFRRHFPEARVITLTQNYRSTAQVLYLANRVLRSDDAPGKQLVAQRSGGPVPVTRGFADHEGELDAIVGQIRTLLGQGVPASEIALIYRVNSQSQALEEALRDADIAYTVRGESGFFNRTEIQQALRALRVAATRLDEDEVPPPAQAERLRPERADRKVENVLRQQLGWHPRREPRGEAARERWRNLGTLLSATRALVEEDERLTFADVLSELYRRAADGAATADGTGGVNLLTYHRAKGLEFDAVLLPACEEGLVPISHAKTPAEVAEERRLLYVGLTRARTHLWVSWAERRPGWGGRMSNRRMSRFLSPQRADARETAKGSGRARGIPKGSQAGASQAGASQADPVLAETLRAWRLERARADAVPAFVVFNDRTLEELAAARPSSVTDLGKVYGIGPAKIERYGEDLLALLR